MVQISSRTRRHASRAAIACFLSASALVSGSARADIGGTYRSPLGPIAITEEDGNVRGIIAGKSPCGFKKGTVVLDGSRLDDSITGEVTSCKMGPGCKGKVQGLAMLLITRSGSVISGYVHTDAGACKTPLGDAGISFRRGKGKAPVTTDSTSGAEPTTHTEPTSSGSGDEGSTASSEGTDAQVGSKGQRGGKEKRATQEKQRSKEPRAGQEKPGSKNPRSGREKRPDDDGARADRGDTGERGGTDTGGTDTGGTASEGTARPAGAEAPRATEEDLDRGEPPVSPGTDARQQAEILANEGLRLMSESKILEARTKFEEAVKVDPAYAEGLNGIGVTYYLTDRYEDAEELYKRALEANPAFPDAYYNLACLYALRQDKDKAFNYLKISVVNGFVAFEQLDKDPDLNSLHDDERYEQIKKGDLW